MENYLKYYWLEKDYLEKEVVPSFHDKGYLTAEQFFAIVFWKSKRRADLIRKTLNDDKSVKAFTSKVYGADNHDDRLTLLLSKEGVGIAMASGILTILYPQHFTVYDYRVRDQLNELCGEKKISDIGALPKNNIEKIKSFYWEYVTAVKEVHPDLSLRDCDRTLWGQSWSVGLQNFLAGVENPVVHHRVKDL